MRYGAAAAVHTVPMDDGTYATTAAVLDDYLARLSAAATRGE